MESDNDNVLPRTCAEAKEIGSKRYFTGKPCKHGHVAARMVSNRRCVECMAKDTKAWREENVGHIQQYRKEYRAGRPEEHAERWAAWYAENREEVLEKKRTRYQENREENLEYAARYREENPEKVKAATTAWRENNPEKVKEGWNTWYAENGKERDRERRSTPRGRIDEAISSAIYNGLKRGKAGRRWEAVVKYTLDELMVHLEKLFQPGMNWDNYGRGGWHVDHKIPRSVFNYNSDDDIDFHRCWSLSNLQPLWEKDNLSKGAKLSAPFQPALSFYPAAHKADNNNDD